MVGGRYSYSCIEKDYTIESTIRDFYNGIIIGKRGAYYYTFVRLKGTRYNLFAFDDKRAYSKVQIINKNYVLTKISRYMAYNKLNNIKT